jgi:hypothetical protein
VDDSRAVLERLDRIEALDRMGAAPGELVEELRALLAEAERWSRCEGGEAGASAVEDLRDALGSVHARDTLSHVPSARNP